jgi:hypothetical protein
MDINPKKYMLLCIAIDKLIPLIGTIGKPKWRSDRTYNNPASMIHKEFTKALGLSTDWKIVAMITKRRMTAAGVKCRVVEGITEYAGYRLNRTF